ncbi:MAG: hypothetical protein BWY57_00166 [Betaproteobacteria bacterium ADurb.Bin341]|nr:MAG: hypothetical protein BWY57_00166 [Betaproteobacteria bacterium ADurb.Bin341]
MYGFFGNSSLYYAAVYAGPGRRAQPWKTLEKLRNRAQKMHFPAKIRVHGVRLCTWLDGRGALRGDRRPCRRARASAGYSE